MKQSFYEQDKRGDSSTLHKRTQQKSEIKSINPIAWFKTRTNLYSRIVIVAKNLLAILVFSIPSKWLFFVTSNIIIKKRCNLSFKII